ncbi:ATP-binding cassette domain-containing protein [Streptomyces sp. 796.1]|uniref:ATP-binding cassette domain-containing protein n=1 Tax=Streptomyces sp. 796.1 TaxID=3163029 RepID=UPI0039C933E0
MFRSPRSAEEVHSRAGAAVTAEGLGVRGPRGWAFRDVSVAAGPGDLLAVVGPSGSGRTCLLLALTGRMRIAAGRAEVAGHRLPRQMSAVRRVTGLGPVPGVSDLEPALTVAEQLHERALLARRFDGPVRGLFRPRRERAATSRARIEDALHRVGWELTELPKGPRTAVRDLERLEALRLSVALALIGAPRLVAVDDVDLKLGPADREHAWSLLRGVADGGTTVLAVCSEPPPGAVVVSTDPADHALTDAAERVEAGTETEPGTQPAPQAEPGTPPGAALRAPAARRAGHRDQASDEGTCDAIAETGRA